MLLRGAARRVCTEASVAAVPGQRPWGHLPGLGTGWNGSEVVLRGRLQCPRPGPRSWACLMGRRGPCLSSTHLGGYPVLSSCAHAAQTEASRRQEACWHMAVSVTQRSTCSKEPLTAVGSLSRATLVYRAIGQALLLPISRSLSIFRQKGRVSSTFCPQPYSVDQINVLIPDQCSQKPINVPFLCPFHSTPPFVGLVFLHRRAGKAAGNLET